MVHWQVEKVKGILKEVKGVSKKIGGLSYSMQQAQGADESKVNREFNETCLRGATLVQSATESLKAMKEEIDRLKLSPDTKSDNDLRIREGLHSTLSRKLKENATEYKSQIEAYKRDMKAKATRQIKILKADATPEEIDTIMTTGSMEQVFKQAILHSAADSVRAQRPTYLFLAHTQTHTHTHLEDARAFVSYVSGVCASR